MRDKLNLGEWGRSGKLPRGCHQSRFHGNAPENPKGREGRKWRVEFEKHSPRGNWGESTTKGVKVILHEKGGSVLAY